MPHSVLMIKLRIMIEQLFFQQPKSFFHHHWTPRLLVWLIAIVLLVTTPLLIFDLRQILPSPFGGGYHFHSKLLNYSSERFRQYASCIRSSQQVRPVHSKKDLLQVQVADAAATTHRRKNRTKKKASRISTGERSIEGCNPITDPQPHHPHLHQNSRKPVGDSFTIATKSQQNDMNLIQREPRVLCIIHTHKGAHESRARQVRQTWASHCDLFFFASNAFDPTLPAFDFTNGGEVEDTYDNLWQKTLSTLLFADEHLSDLFDFVYKADDDTFCIVENLRHLLSQFRGSEDAVVVGQRLRLVKDISAGTYDTRLKSGYLSGGSGYAISKVALRKFATEMKQNHCPQQSRFEDAQFGMCLDRFGIKIHNALDSDQKPQMSPLSLVTLLNNETESVQGQKCCSSDLISTHYVHDGQMLSLYYFIYSVRVHGPPKRKHE